MAPKMSIIVTSPTEERRNDLIDLLDSLAAQTETDIELVFVGENSPRLVQEIKEYAYQRGIVGTFILNRGSKGLAQARNLGMAFVKSPITAMIDDDVILPPHWAEEMLRSFDNTEVIGATGPAYPHWEDDKMSWLPEEFYWLISCTAWDRARNPQNIRSAWGMNMAFRTSIILDVGGLLEASGYHKPMAEDLEFSLRARFKTGKRIVFNSRAFVWHRVHSYRFTWRFVLARSKHIGTSRYMIRRLYGARYEREIDLAARIVKSIAKPKVNSPADLVRLLKLSLVVGCSLAIGYLTAAFVPTDEDRQFILAVNEKWNQIGFHAAIRKRATVES